MTQSKIPKKQLDTTLVDTTTAQTLTNKRMSPRTSSTTTAATLTPDYSVASHHYRTTQTATLTINLPTGSMVAGESLYIKVQSVAAQTLTINAGYVVFGAAFPAATTAGKAFLMTVTFDGTVYDTTWANEI